MPQTWRTWFSKLRGPIKYLAQWIKIDLTKTCHDKILELWRTEKVPQWFMEQEFISYKVSYLRMVSDFSMLLEAERNKTMISRSWQKITFNLEFYAHELSIKPLVELKLFRNTGSQNLPPRHLFPGNYWGYATLELEKTTRKGKKTEISSYLQKKWFLEEY